MTYEEFKANYSLNDLNKIVNPSKELRRYISKVKHTLYDLLFILSYRIIKIDFNDYLTKEYMNKKLNVLLDEQQKIHDNLIANRILSYEDFKKGTLNDWGNLNIDLYTDEELANVVKWSLQACEELRQARIHNKLISEGIDVEDEITKEEENIPIQQLIDEAKSRWIK